MKLSDSLMKISTAAGLLLMLSTPAFASSNHHEHANANHKNIMVMKHPKNSKMSMTSSSSIKGVKIDHHAKFKKGEHVIVLANHMKGMRGARATVDNAYQTKLYEVDYLPTNGGKIVKNHKWVITSEIKTQNKNLKIGSRIILKANHMVGMEGAHAKIVAIHNGPAYMINYRPTNSKQIVKNHKWLIQSELNK